MKDSNSGGFRETFRRAARTFLQAAIGYITANVALVPFDDGSTLKRALIGLAASGVACGIAAAMNLPARNTSDGCSGAD